MILLNDRMTKKQSFGEVNLIIIALGLTLLLSLYGNYRIEKGLDKLEKNRLELKKELQELERNLDKLEND